VTERTGRRRRIVALFVGALLLLGLSTWALTYTSLFQAHHIRVTGVNVLTPDEVRGLGEVDASTNVVHVDRDAVVSRLEASPWVADASVLVELPDTLELRITERRPIGLIDALGEHGVLSSDATVLPMAPGVPDGLPAVRAALGAPTESQRQAAAAILMAIDPVVSKRVSAVTVGQDGLVTLTLTSGTTVQTGAAGDEAAKAEALRAVLRWASSDDLELTSIDVSAPTAPSATLSDGSTLTP
jgi:cell division protein FtsQ